MVPTEAPGSLLSNKLLLIENGQNGHQMAQFEGCVGKVMNEPSPVGVISIFLFVAFLKGIDRPSMAAIEAHGSPLSN